MNVLERLATDPVFFVKSVWSELGLLPIDPVDDIWADMIWFGFTGRDWPDDGVLRHDIDQPPDYKKRCVLAPRGCGKTYKIVCAQIAWDHFRNPHVREKVISQSSNFAGNLVSQIRQWYRSVPFLQHLQPGEHHRDQSFQFDVGLTTKTKDPSLEAKGIDGQITGTRAHKAFGDDVETKSNTMTADARARLADKSSELFNIASYGNQEVVYVGTYHHEDSLYMRIAERGYVVRAYPLASPQQKDIVMGLAPFIQDRLHDGRLKYTENGRYDLNPCFPNHFGPEQIRERMAEGATNFAKQYMLISNLGDSLRYPLRLRDLIVFEQQDRRKCPVRIDWGTTDLRTGKSTEIDKNIAQAAGLPGDKLYGPWKVSDTSYEASDGGWVDYHNTSMWIDPAGSGRDQTAFAVVSNMSGKLYCHEVGGLHGGYETRALEDLAAAARRNYVRTIYVEDVAMQGMFSKLLDPVVQRFFLDRGEDPDHPEGWKCAVIAKKGWAVGQKERRIIDTLEPVMNQHRLVVHPRVLTLAVGCDPVYTLQYQLTRLRQDRGCLGHDDMIEALAACVWTFEQDMALDPDRMADEHRRRWIDQQAEEMIARMGGKPKDKRWYARRSVAAQQWGQ